MFRLTVMALTAFGLFVAAPARAACEYHGVVGARTTVAQEFRDSTTVVRARVVSADYHWDGEGVSWTLYHLRVLDSFKGGPGRAVDLFTTRDSGGFYLDGEGGVPDLDQDYLLFLDVSRQDLAPRGAMSVNYSCGRSGPWSEIPTAERAWLERSSGRPR